MTIGLENHLPWPYTLESIAVALDGELLYRRSADMPQQVLVADLRGLPAGDHTVQIHASVLYKSGTMGDPCSIRVRSARTVELGNRSAVVTLDIHATGVTRDFVRRVQLDIRTSGAVPSREVAGVPTPAHVRRQAVRGEPDDRGCNSLSGVDQTICRAETWLRYARDQRDIVKVTCYNDKLVQMNAFRDVLRRSAGEEERARSAGDQLTAAHEQAKMQIAGSRIDQLWQELQSCVCEYPAFLSDLLERLPGKPACTGAEGVGPLAEEP